VTWSTSSTCVFQSLLNPCRGRELLRDYVDMLRSVVEFITAPQSHRQAIVTALVILPRVALRLRRHGYIATRAWLATRPRRPLGRDRQLLLGRTDRAMRRMPWRPRCLERSLVVWWLAGEAASIRLGVAPAKGGSPRRFHAWVEEDGVVLNDHPDVASHFLPIRLSDSEAPHIHQFD
jgi:Transglutaminase-like superfamily